MNGRHVLVARLDAAGDMLLAGPAIRAVAASAGRVTVLCGPAGREAASLLPGVDRVVERRAAWIDPEPAPFDSATACELVERVAALAPDEAIILTSFHQSALALALLLRLTRVPVVAAISEDSPGSLLDVRHHVPDEVHEMECSLSLAATLGYRLPLRDDGGLLVDLPGGASRVPAELAGRPFVVVHPGASVPARCWPAQSFRRFGARLTECGLGVAVTGSPAERRQPGRLALRGDAAVGALAAVGRALRAAQRRGRPLRRLPGPGVPGLRPSLRGAMGATADARARARHGWDPVACQTADVYQSLISEGRSRQLLDEVST